jgi:short-subunit dehydrogenase
MAGRFQGRTVLVTGASSGVGAATARLFAQEGARVVLAARSAAKLEALAREIGAGAIPVPGDVSDPAHARALVERAVHETGALHVLVNNAGANHRGPLAEADPEALARVVDVNLRAPVLLTRFALPHLLQEERAAVVQVASLAGRVPLAGEATYSGTKFGLRGFSLALAEELRGTGVSVSLVSPGPIATGFLLDDLDRVPDLVFSQPMLAAEEVARAVVACAHDGRRERALPGLSGVLATAGYLAPALSRALRPVLEAQGRRAKARHRRERSA